MAVELAARCQSCPYQLVTLLELVNEGDGVAATELTRELINLTFQIASHIGTDHLARLAVSEETVVGMSIFTGLAPFYSCETIVVRKEGGIESATAHG